MFHMTKLTGAFLICMSALGLGAVVMICQKPDLNADLEVEYSPLDTARETMLIFENACKRYMLEHQGRPPRSLSELLEPTDGHAPWVEGGESMLKSPYGDGKRFQYDPDHRDFSGNLDPIVSLKTPYGKTLYSSRDRQP